MRRGRLCFLALLAVGGCTALAGLDGDYAVDESGTGTGASGGDETSSNGGAPSSTSVTSGGQGGGQQAGVGGTGGSGGTGGIVSTGGSGGTVQTDPCSEAGLIACYQFEGDAADSSTAQNHATVTNGVYAAGMVGQALDHDVGTLFIAPAAALVSSPITVEFWMRPTVIQTSFRTTIVDHSGQYGVFILPGGVLQCRAGSLVSANQVTPNVWTHVACVFEDNEISIYMGGSLVVAAPNTGLGTTPTTIYIGTDVPSGGELVGQLDVFRFFDRVRTSAEICASAGKVNCP